MFHKSQNKPDLIFELFLLLLVFLPPRTGCTPPTTWCIPPTKHVFCIINALSNLSCACFEPERLFPPAAPSRPALLPPSRWEFKQMSSRGPSNLNNCMILWPCVLDADLGSQAFFSFFIIIPSSSCSRSDYALHALSAFQLQTESLILCLRAVSLSFAFHEFLLKPFFQTRAFCNANRICGRGHIAAVHPPDQNHFRVSLWFPTFPCMDHFFVWLAYHLAQWDTGLWGLPNKIRRNSVISLKKLLCC